MLELVLRSYAQRGFIGSFYFMLDAVATLTMIMDFLPLVTAPSLDEEDDTGGGAGMPPVAMSSGGGESVW